MIGHKAAFAAAFAALLALPAAAQQTGQGFGNSNSNTGQGFGQQAPATGQGFAPAQGGQKMAAPQQPVQPMSNILSASNPEGLANAVRSAGYKATVETDSYGDSVIRSAAGGINYSIYFYGCADGQTCQTLTFSAGFDLNEGTDAQAMNDWNRNKRFSYAYIDDEGDPFLNYDINLEDGGIPEPTFLSSLALWDIRVGQFLEHIDW